MTTPQEEGGLAERLRNACRVVEVIKPASVKRELQDWFSDMQLQEYLGVFGYASAEGGKISATEVNQKKRIMHSFFPEVFFFFHFSSICHLSFGGSHSLVSIISFFFLSSFLLFFFSFLLDFVSFLSNFFLPNFVFRFFLLFFPFRSFCSSFVFLLVFPFFALQRRYAWLRRKLQELSEAGGWGEVFPEHWQLPVRIAREFCLLSSLFHLNFFFRFHLYFIPFFVHFESSHSSVLR